jgi:hypothetical protein
MDMAVLASAPIDIEVERTNSFDLLLQEITLEAGVETGNLAYPGIPWLYIVMSKEVNLSEKGEVSSLGMGDAAFVEAGNRHELNNPSDEPALLLRFALVPPDSEFPVSRGAPPDTDFPGQPGEPNNGTSRLVFRGGVPADDAYDRLFVGCLTWSDPATGLGTLASTGPFGVFVISGIVQTGKTGGGELGAGDCFVYQAGTAPYFQVGDELPTVLVAGVLPKDAAWWVDLPFPPPSTDTTVMYDVDCASDQ